MSTKYTKMVLFIAGMAAFASCSTAYKMGQTPDDVYYSPAKPQSEYASNDRDRDGGDSYYTPGNSRNNRYNANQTTDPYYSGYDMYRNDRFLRMSIGSRSRWMGYNDYLSYDGMYNYNRFNMYNDFYYDSPWNSYTYWNSFYNPYSPMGYGGFGMGYSPYYGGGGIIAGGSVGKYPTSSVPSARPRAFNPAGYTNNSFTNNNRYLNTNTYTNTGTNNTGRYNNSSNNRNANSYYNNSNNNNRSVSPFRNTTPNNSFYNNNSNNNSSPTRSYTPSSSGSSFGGGGGSSSGGGGGVSRPTRGGN